MTDKQGMGVAGHCVPPLLGEATSDPFPFPFPRSIEREGELGATLNQRGEKYGDYEQMAQLAQNIKDQMRLAPNWHKLTWDKRESMDMIALKLARLLTGDPEDFDSWHDIEGYARLAKERLRGRQGATP